MRLSEHRDFQQAIVQAAEHFAERGLRPALIEKDYYVTEALRAIAATVGDKVIFKGGTSLSKGWNLIQRFSEDVDIFLDPRAFDPALGRNGINRELKALRDTVAAQPGLTFLPDGSQTIGGFGRSDRFAYEQAFRGPGEVAGTVLVEAGQQAVVNRRPTSRFTRTLPRSWPNAASHSVQRTRAGSRCACSISAARSLRSCSRFTRRWNCTSARDAPSVPTCAQSRHGR